MPLRYVGSGQAFRRLPAEDLTDDAIEAAAARSLQGADDLTRDLLASGLYAVDTRKPKVPKPKVPKEKPMTETPENDGKASKAVEDSSIEAKPTTPVLSTDEAIEKIEDAPEKE